MVGWHPLEKDAEAGLRVMVYLWCVQERVRIVKGANVKQDACKDLILLLSFSGSRSNRRKPSNMAPQHWLSFVVMGWSLLSFILRAERNYESHSDVRLVFCQKKVPTNPYIMFMAAVVVCGGWYSSGHMVFDYWRWRVRPLSAHCGALSEAETQVKAHHWSLTHANELISLNMHQASASSHSGRGVSFAEITGTSHFPLCQCSMSSDLREMHVWPVSEQLLTILHRELCRDVRLLRKCGDGE